jgi:hypothetical protein
MRSNEQFAEASWSSHQDTEEVAANESPAGDNSTTTHTPALALDQVANITALPTTPESPMRTTGITPANLAAPLSDATDFDSLGSLPWIDWENVFDDFTQEYSHSIASEAPLSWVLGNDPDVLA